MPNPALWGVVVGVLRIVPYVGSMVAASLPIALSLVAFDSWLPPLLVFLALGARAQLYQRLLTMDQPEAHAIVDRFLKEKSLVELYDSVLLPALSLAEQDRHKGAIDTARGEFLFLSINELISELSDYQPAHDSAAAECAPAEPGLGERLSARILCLPANDRAEEVTADMLAQILVQAGHEAVSLPIAHASPAKLLALIKRRQDDVICISALPPCAFPPARTMCRVMSGTLSQTQTGNRSLGVQWGSGEGQGALRTNPTRSIAYPDGAGRWADPGTDPRGSGG